MTRVLVTGAGGFIGRQTLAPLLNRGFEVHGVHLRPGSPPQISGVSWHRADLLDPGERDGLLRAVAPSHLLHLAWYTEPGRFWTATENLAWVRASLSLLEAFAGLGGHRAVVAGTCAEYAWGQRTVCAEGRTPCEPATLYGAAKHGLRVIAEAYAAEAGLSLAWGRVFFVFGPGESERRLGGSVAAALVGGRRAPCSEGGQLRDFLCSIDLGDAFAALLGSPVTGPVNLASGHARPVRELVLTLGDAAGRLDLIDLGARPSPTGEPAQLAADVTRLRAEVGWTPAATLAQRAAETIAWWRAQPVPAPSARVTRS